MKLPTKRVFLAPMEEVNDLAFRLMCKKAGAELTWTQLTSPLDVRKQALNDKPIFQLMGKSTRGVSKFIKKYDGKVSGWDFNLGCPAKTAKSQCYGAYLEDLEIIENIIKLMRKNTSKPLSIKIRKSKISFDLLKIAEKYCDWIAIHPRNRAQGYSGEPDLEWAKEFKAKSKIPVIYSGNVDEKNCKVLLEVFDYVMIGRKAIGRPEIFVEIGKKRGELLKEKKKKSESTFKDYLILAEKFELPFRQIKFQAMQFSKGKRGSRRLRLKIYESRNLEELKRIFLIV